MSPAAVMAHTQDEQLESVAARLHVLLCPAQGGGYLAQGIEIDYTATGRTEDEAKEHFAAGFTKTILAYLERGRSIEGLFKTKTPLEYVMKFYEGGVHPELCCVVSRQRMAIPAATPVPHELAFVRTANA